MKLIRAKLLAPRTLARARARRTRAFGERSSIPVGTPVSHAILPGAASGGVGEPALIVEHVAKMARDLDEKYQATFPGNKPAASRTLTSAHMRGGFGRPSSVPRSRATKLYVAIVVVNVPVAVAIVAAIVGSSKERARPGNHCARCAAHHCADRAPDYGSADRASRRADRLLGRRAGGQGQGRQHCECDLVHDAILPFFKMIRNRTKRTSLRPGISTPSPDGHGNWTGPVDSLQEPAESPSPEVKGAGARRQECAFRSGSQ